ncbi:MAG: bifunctional UDP-N-acetylmuramoyl-tripeptide:D-alanyl-D-alanine ligase/alanine racemase [Bacteroidetes bacterium GWA2_30_7]|nr:MAG: bifunctional UDP-N-acetylmuramoyl-tripeptide:D-alanyl-D-alanine ligase/alanine racemase [Bacteroidetes bacterium GWA2_30_7]
MSEYKIDKIATVVGGKISGTNLKISFRYLLTDSRSLISPSETIFFAITGKRHDGHKYIDELYKKGLRAFVVSSVTETEKYKNAAFILVENTVVALQKLAQFHRNKFKIPVIGITGSNGKTIVKEWLSQLLSPEMNIAKSPRSYNSQIGVPLSVWQLEDNSEIGIFEAGISLTNEMENLADIIKPEIGIFTNIGQAHQENFESLNQKISEKLKLFNSCKTIIYCSDYDDINEAIINKYSDKNLLTWSKENSATLKIKSINKSINSTKIKANNFEIEIPFIDDASIENAITCWLTMLHLNYSNETIKERIKNLTPIEMRMELKAGINDCLIINDSYNSDIGSLIIALDYLKQQHQFSQKTVILSDILESSKNEAALYKEVASIINKSNIFRFIGIGEGISKYSDLFKVKKHFFINTSDFINHIAEYQLKNEAILLKGARIFQFERISSILQYKVHETVLEVNLNAVVHNLNYYKSLLKPETKVMAMVKAFSYGSGILEISNLLAHQRIDYLAVAYIDEGIELRKAGITIPIMIMNPEESGFGQMFEFNLEPEIYSLKILNSFIKAQKYYLSGSYPIHLKIDTGMKRLGFLSSEVDDLINILSENNSIIIKSVFTHLVATEDNAQDVFTRFQVDTFLNTTKKIEKHLKYGIIKHVLNSAGVERFSEYQFDMVRLGIGLYGVSSVSKDKLMNVCSLKTIISQIKTLEANDTVGYNRKGKLKKTGTVATIPIGYADGLHRILSNGTGKVMINNKLAPIIGNICMDMTMINISGIEAKEGDEVIIFNENFPIEYIARYAATIPYEILTSISRRVKRVYFQE